MKLPSRLRERLAGVVLAASAHALRVSLPSVLVQVETVLVAGKSVRVMVTWTADRVPVRPRKANAEATGQREEREVFIGFANG